MCAANAIRLILVLCALETHFARCQTDIIEFETEEISPCDHSLNMSTKSHIRDLAIVFTNIDEKNDVLNIEYGTDLEIMCWGVNVTTIALTKDGVKFETELKYDTGMQWRTTPNEATAKYVCTDTENDCGISLTVRVTPAFIATLTHSNLSLGQVIPYGNYITLQCSSFDASQLVITKDGNKLLTEKVNETTIQWTGKPEVYTSMYVCTDMVTKFDRRKGITVQPNIYVQSRNETIKDIYDITRGAHFYRLNYGDYIQVFCSGSRPVRLISEDKEEIKIDHINGTAVKSFMRILDKGSETFTCIDTEFPDYKSKVRVVVAPRIVVLAPNIRNVDGEFVMKYGDPLEILCIGPDAEQLQLWHGLCTTPLMTIKHETLNTHLVNKTTIKWIANETELNKIHDYNRYFCTAKDEKTSVIVKVDRLPETTDFRCISHAYQYLNCSWKSTSISSNFTLFTTKTGVYDRICSKVRSVGQNTRFCVWYDDDYLSYESPIDLSFLMQTCNDIGCNNQTFRIDDHRSIVKAYPPQNLAIYNASSKEVVLRFRGYRTWNNELSYKHKVEVDCLYSDLGPIEMEDAKVYCGHMCRVKVVLPCPGQDYQVRVYRRFKEAVGDEFWSEPSSVRVYGNDINVSGCAGVQKSKKSC